SPKAIRPDSEPPLIEALSHSHANPAIRLPRTVRLPAGLPSRPSPTPLRVRLSRVNGPDPLTMTPWSNPAIVPLRIVVLSLSEVTPLPVPDPERRWPPRSRVTPGAPMVIPAPGQVRSLVRMALVVRVSPQRSGGPADWKPAVTVTLAAGGT